jgi:hypothetical protein
LSAALSFGGEVPSVFLLWPRTTPSLEVSHTIFVLVYDSFLKKEALVVARRWEHAVSLTQVALPSAATTCGKQSSRDHGSGFTVNTKAL